MPPPKDDTEPNWTWSTGKERHDPKEKGKESFEERQKTRAALMAGEQLAHAQTRKEKRKRDLGQASRFMSRRRDCCKTMASVPGSIHNQFEFRATGTKRNCL
ncbi:hypothetical protein LINGRAHAP2_LOCUS36264 [Linum grandiflorum]